MVIVQLKGIERDGATGAPSLQHMLVCLYGSEGKEW